MSNPGKVAAYVPSQNHFMVGFKIRLIEILSVETDRTVSKRVLENDIVCGSTV
jgi:hypothetical protein